uniref:Uncharacterized protein n=1 Tax=Kuenenia stuttgartiensis TaxID=174633 RepID=Q1PV27_KUEST|nr:unknown protein [Candidatus Kuenenia stuttgartiensis]
MKKFEKFQQCSATRFVAPKKSCAIRNRVYSNSATNLVALQMTISCFKILKCYAFCGTMATPLKWK